MEEIFSKNWIRPAGQRHLEKYYSAYKAFTKFCSEENIVNPWPISKSSIVCFILWCKKYLKIKASTTKSYLSALHTISKMLGLKSQKSSKEASKLLVRGLERSEKQDKKISSAPLIFKILVALKNILDAKKWKKQSKKVVWASICLGYFGSFRAAELLTMHQNLFDPSSNCTWNDIKIFSKNHMSVTIKNPKTKGGKSEKIELFGFLTNVSVLSKQSFPFKNCHTKNRLFQHSFAGFSIWFWKIPNSLCSLWYFEKTSLKK